MKRKSQLKTENRSAVWYYNVTGLKSGDTASQQRRPAEREVREEERVEDRKEETTREMKEQRTLYIRVKRRGTALSNRVRLNPKRQRIDI